MRVFLALALAVGLMLALPGASAANSHGNREQRSPPPTPSPTPSATASPTRSASPLPEPRPTEEPFPEPEKPGFFDIIGRVRYAISQWFANLVTSALRPVFDFLGRTVFSTPAVASNDRIVQLWGISLAVADAVLLLFLLFGAGLVTVSGGLSSQLTAKELLPRLLVAAIAANVSLIVLNHLTDLSNALSRGVMGSLTPSEVSRLMIRFLAHAALGNPFLALLALALIVFGILVIITYVIRAAALVVLTAAAPLLLIGHALPHTEGYAQSWWRAVIALLLAPVAQSLLLAAAFRVMLTGNGVLGLPIGSGFIDILVIGTLLYFLFKVPFWMLRAAFSQAGARAVVHIKQAARAATRAAPA
ncbi:MAG TPA: conjugal transfer protein TrbL family protein [Actinomycetota bacterium]|nr:conjugal transfer protein TrbL family protein [Actinomycetota bacterium]